MTTRNCSCSEPVHRNRLEIGLEMRRLRLCKLKKGFEGFEGLWGFLLVLFALCVMSFPAGLVDAQSSPLVFAHYMLITRPPENDYTNDITLAKDAGVDAFAINYGGQEVDWSVQEGYLADFYAAAQAQSIKVFISFDTTSNPALTTTMCIDLANRYANHPAQLKVDNKMMISSFQTTDPPRDWTTDILPNVSVETQFLQGTLSDDASAIFSSVRDGAFPWIHQTKTADEESATNEAYASSRGQKKWMAGIAPWFFKRLDQTQNWSQAQDETILISRFQHLLSLRPDFIQLLTWNDWGESTYFGPADTTRLYPPAYYSDLDHSGFLAIAKLFIQAFKTGDAALPAIDPSSESVFLFYQLQPHDALGSQDTLPLPLDYNYLKDEVFVVTLLASAADVVVSSGGTVTSFAVQGGVAVTGVPWTVGAQSVAASRNGVEFVNKSGGPDVTGNPTMYNGNAVIL